jgi:UDP-N-acetylmuramoylalanine--D-glutamate ligase
VSIQRTVEGQPEAALPVTAPPGTFVPPPRAGEVQIGDLATLDLAEFDALILSPGVPLNTHSLAAAARAAGVPIIGDIELFAQARSQLPPHKVVGITGTNGKSTTTALVTHILKTAGVPALMGGNIGVPILAQEPLPAGGVYVLELSSYQIDLTQTLDCDVAVLLNITPDHLDRYDGSFEAYAASKARLFEMQKAEHVAVFGVDDPEAQMLSVAHVLGTHLEELSVEDATSEWTLREARVADVTDQSAWPALTGPHNAQNAAAAIKVCESLNIEAEKIDRGLRTFPGLPHRMERVATLGGVTWYDDSKATNPESTAPALAAFPRVHWILGGRAKGEDLDACLPHLGHVAHAYTIGEAGPVFARVLEPRVPVTQAETLERAVKLAAERAQRGEVVLLSPAAASFDQFRDYEHRGQVFRQLVEALA